MTKELPKRRVCTHCKEEKDISFFTIRKATNKPVSWCKMCVLSKHKEMKYATAYRQRDPQRALFISARGRAKKRGVLFTLTKEDIVVPEYCPVLGIKLGFSNSGKNGGASNSYSLDRINPKGGYIAENIVVMSHLANSMKRDATPEQLLLFAKWVINNYG